MLDTSELQPVEFFPYRTKRTLKALFTFDRDSFRNIEKEWCKQLGVDPDNHSVIKVKNIYSGEIMYFWFHDFKVYLGLDIIDQRY